MLTSFLLVFLSRFDFLNMLWILLLQLCLKVVCCILTSFQALFGALLGMGDAAFGGAEGNEGVEERAEEKAKEERTEAKAPVSMPLLLKNVKYSDFLRNPKLSLKQNKRLMKKMRAMLNTRSATSTPLFSTMKKR
jgi:hypothetical protein